MSSTPSTQVARALALIAGTGKRFPGNTPLVFGGASQTPTQVSTTLQGFVDASNAVITAHALYEAKVVARRALVAAALALMKAYEAYIKATFGNQPDVLKDFGLAVAKTTKPTVATQVVAVSRRAATRVARGTKGKKAKKAIKGVVAAPAPAAAK